ncbi:MAG: ribonucleoside-diphosphate reductase, adenosylcobalamin-dependent [Burkholderiales bacterium]|nr:ribonucleoside-diphosphate reductase, adenosylcobalamin-dependent [Burkholderiales bacterium]
MERGQCSDVARIVVRRYDNGFPAVTPPAPPMKLNDLVLDRRAAMPAQDISDDVLREKYAKGDEQTIGDVRRRVARALAAIEPADRREQWERAFELAQEAGFIPGGRISSAAGTDLKATLINCFVQPIGDAISADATTPVGIYDALQQAAETMRRGGGVGYDFSPIRPAGAWVRGTQSNASGPLSYMRVFDESCKTVESAGSRRGAQMGMLRCDHPDIEAFIHAKDRGDFRNFNLSVACTDAFMEAVVSDAAWDLVHAAPAGEAMRAAGAHQRSDGMWVYRTVRARDLWNEIMASTYDHAEPGVIFIDTINRDNNLAYCETIAATNPCVSGDTWVQTTEGPRQVVELLGKPFLAVVDGKPYPSGPNGFFKTGTKPLVRLSTVEGHALRLTAEHRIRRVARMTAHRCDSEWIAVSELRPGDRVVLHDHRESAGWAGRYGEAEGYLMGLLIGDGTLHAAEGAVLSIWDPGLGLAASGDVTYSPVATGMVRAADSAFARIGHREGYTTFGRSIGGRGEVRKASRALGDIAGSLGLSADHKHVTPDIEACSSAFASAFLRGYFDADGSVQGSQLHGASVRLTQCHLGDLEAVQRMLLRLGIVARLYRNRKPAGFTSMPDGRGGQRRDATQPLHELVISGASLVRYAEVVGFADEQKQARLRHVIATYRRAANRERFVATVASLTDDGTEDVYDVNIADVHAFDANGLYVHNCGEQPLPPYGCCDLGSIDLTAFVRDPFAPTARFDFDGYRRVVAIAVRMLDNVLDATVWPLAQQHAEAMAKRRIGLGFTGLGDALLELNLRYDSDEGRAKAGELARETCVAAYRASIELAKEKGAFPRFDAERYLAAPGFASRLPQDIKDAIREHGIRNSHLLSIAPTGTISLAFADNASNGIEPPFSWQYTRKKRMPDDSMREYRVEDHAYRLYKHVHGLDDAVTLVPYDAAKAGSLPLFDDSAHGAATSVAPGRVWTDADGKRYAMLPPHFVTALDMSALDHMRMSAAVQPYIDSAISKTVNVPADYPFADFEDLYLQAWRAGLKGITTYRPNDVLGAVLEVAPATAAVSREDLDQTDPDRRVRLDVTVQPPLASLRWPGRPELLNGNPCWTYVVRHPHGDFAVFIGHIENGQAHPFEVWVNGAEQPRGLGALAKTLSMDMRAEDRRWLDKKLSALARTSGDDGFDLVMPPDGNKVRCPSLVAGFAALVRYRCNELGAFDDRDAPSPVMDALMTAKEPKAGPDGTLSWTVDIVNPATGDDFVMFLKELVMPDGQRRPYSVWLSGDYPRSFDGLCKALSLDMRVTDPAWIAMKLRKLLNYGESNAAFMARTPGSPKSATYPSTIAYLAQLMIHRYAMLGILTEDGYPVAHAGILTVPVDERAAGTQYRVLPGKKCPECGNRALIRKDGCEFCTQCGHMGACG